MKANIVKNSFYVLFTSFFIVSCGPTSVAVRTRPNTSAYVRPVAPSATHIWVGDSWNWRNNQYNYQPGYWVVPRQRQIYVNGYWNNSGRGAQWVPGHWQRR